MSVYLGSIAVTAVAVVLCAAVGLSTDAAPLLKDWLLQMEEASVPVDPEIVRFSIEAVRGLARYVPLRGWDYAVVSGLRVFTWTPVAMGLVPVLLWAFVSGLGRRAEIAAGTRAPSPTIAFLAKRGMCLSVFAGFTAVFVPIAVPGWFAFLPAAGLAACLYVYVSNLPDRL
jgi:hypothetical protein